MVSYLRSALLAVLLATLSACGAIQPATTSVGAAIRVEQPWARAALLIGAGGDHGAGQSHDAATSTSAVYMTLVNTGASADAIVAVASDAAEVVEPHSLALENNVARMRPVQRIEIPADGSVALKPGGFHLMLIGIKRDLRPGDTLNLTLTLQSGATLQVAVPVREQAP